VGTQSDDSLGIQCDLAPESRRLVMTFGGFYGEVLEFGGEIHDATGRLPAYEFARSLRSVPLKRVYVRDHAAAWYHKGVAGVADDIDAVADRLREIASCAEDVVVLGNSAGGYGALLFGALLAAEVHVFSPQTFIAPHLREAHGDSRWIPQMAALGSDLDLRYADLRPVIAKSEGTFHVYYGVGHTLDVIHAEHLGQLPQVTLHPIDYDRHDVIDGLRERGWLAEFVQGLVTGTPVPVPHGRIGPTKRVVAGERGQGIVNNREPGSPEVFVTFGGNIGALGNLPDDVGRHPALFAGKTVHVRDYARACYQLGVVGAGDDVDSVAERLRAVCSGGRRVVMLGTGTGGYGALLFGALLGAEVHAFAAPSFIDPELREIHGDRRWADAIAALDGRLDRRYADLLPVLADSDGRFHVYYADGFPLGALHSERLREVPRVTLHAFRYERADLVPALRACGWMDSFVRALGAGTTVTVPETPIPPPPSGRRGSPGAALRPSAERTGAAPA
jgi:hypothetical protein